MHSRTCSPIPVLVRLFTCSFVSFLLRMLLLRLFRLCHCRSFQVNGQEFTLIWINWTRTSIFDSDLNFHFIFRFCFCFWLFWLLLCSYYCNVQLASADHTLNKFRDIQVDPFLCVCYEFGMWPSWLSMVCNNYTAAITATATAVAKTVTTICTIWVHETKRHSCCRQFDERWENTERAMREMQ